MGEDCTVILAEEKNVEDNSKGKGRRRKKLLYETIRQQMEFYFSDANLTKDRFLRQLVEKDPYVSLDIFLTFNKINSMVSSVVDLAKAVKRSDVLELSENQLAVHRKTPFVHKDNQDECTIYVENLLPETTHESLTKIFSEFGKVVYVSIPKFHSTQSIKGFAFVEFDTPEEAKTTIQLFREKGSCLSSQMLPEKLCSIQTFEDPNTNKQKSKKPKGAETESNAAESKQRKRKKSEGDNVEDVAKSEMDRQHKKERKSEPEPSLNKVSPSCDQKHKKKKKCDASSLSEPAADSAIKPEVENVADQVELSKQRKRSRTAAEISDDDDQEKRKITKQSGTVSENALESENICTENQESTEIKSADEENGGGTESKKKKHRKQKKKPKEDRSVFAYGLHILPKQEWKRLRNKYLDMQRAHMRKLKQQLLEARFVTRGWNNQYTPASVHTVQEGNGQQEDVQQAPAGTDAGTKPRVAFTPGVIVRVKFNEPVVDVKTFKAEARSQTSVQYVDIHEGACEAYLRCATAPDSQHLLQAQPWNQMSLLQGDEENAYWDKIFKDRKEKIDNKTRVGKERGRKKLLRKAEAIQATHLRFDS